MPRGRRRKRDPTPAEIEAATRKIREKWSEAKHRRRAGLRLRIDMADRRVRLSVPKEWTED